MTATQPLGRLPIESSRPIAVFAVTRLLLALLALGLVVALGFPYGGELGLAVGGVAVPWSLFNLWLARRAPDRALNPLVVIGDAVVLAIVDVIVPEIYGPVRFMALAFLAVHAHFQGGERAGLAVSALAVAILLSPSAVLTQGGELRGELLLVWEVVFAAATLATVALVGRFRTAESASRLRARELSRRTLLAESGIRRRVSEALHDGPLQELIGLDMVLGAAGAEAERAGAGRTGELIAEARTLAERNVALLRDEMIELGPYAYRELSFASWVERCTPVWRRRYGIETTLAIEPLDLSAETEGELFRITQEAVINAVRHGGATGVRISLSVTAGRLRLEIADDGRGFGGADPLEVAVPGHIGLASMRERAELLGGELRIESSSSGATVTVTAPAAAPD